MPDLQMQPTKWWRVIAPDGSLRAETSNEDDARQRVRPGDTLQRLYMAQTSQWVTQ
jgi:hypothetical protein